MFPLNRSLKTAPRLTKIFNLSGMSLTRCVNRYRLANASAMNPLDASKSDTCDSCLRVPDKSVLSPACKCANAALTAAKITSLSSKRNCLSTRLRSSEMPGCPNAVLYTSLYTPMTACKPFSRKALARIGSLTSGSANSSIKSPMMLEKGGNFLLVYFTDIFLMTCEMTRDFSSGFQYFVGNSK